MKCKLIAIAIAAVVFSSGATAADSWLYITQGANDVKYSVTKLDTLDASRFTLWVKAVKPDDTYTVRKSLVDCAAETAVSVLGASYGADGVQISLSSTPGTPVPIVPGSVGAALFTPVCESLKTKAAGMKNL